MLAENYACEDELGSRLGGREIQKKKKKKKKKSFMFERANSQRKMKSEN